MSRRVPSGLGPRESGLARYNLDMAVEILMPELGESVHEGTVSRWLKKVGDFVKEDEPVVEIMTDKVNTELPSPASGILVKILINEGEPVEVFHAMGVIDDEGDGSAATSGDTAHETTVAVVKGDKLEAVTPQGGTTSDVTAPAAQAAPAPKREPSERRWYSPVVRSMAKAHNVSEDQLDGIAGSGEHGRVTKRDLEAYLGGKGVTPTMQAPTPKAAPAEKPKLEEKPAPATVAGPDQEVVTLTGLRKMIADHMVKSSQVPTVTTVTEVDVTNMVKFRTQNKDTFAEQFGVKLTYTPFFIKAICDAVAEYPLINAAFMPDGKVVMNKVVHMGVAVSLGPKGDQGLIVPVIKDCSKKGLIEIAKELESIAAKARSNSLAVDDVQGGTITLTNPGSYGAILGTPMINAPQAAILGTYTIKKQPMIIDDMIAVRSVMNLVLTYDHRIIDGGVAGRFLLSLKQKLEAFDFFK